MDPIFPEVDGRSLEDESVSLPGGLEGDLNLLAVAFHRTHQRDVDTWIPLFRQLENEIDGLAGYEIPTISGGWKPVRRFIDGGMKAAIPDPLTRRRTVTVYGDVGRVTDALGLAGKDEIAIVLCDREGQILWMTIGAMPGGPPPELLEALDVGL